MKAPPVGPRVSEHAQLALGRVLRHADGDLLGNAGRLVERVLGIDLQPAPLFGAGRALEVVRLRLAEGEEAADPVVSVVGRRDADRPLATDDAAVGEGLSRRTPDPRVTPPAHLALGVGHLELIRTRRRGPIELEHDPGVVLEVVESPRLDPLADRPLAIQRQADGRIATHPGGSGTSGRAKGSVDGEGLPECVAGDQLDGRGPPVSLDAAAERRGVGEDQGLAFPAEPEVGVEVAAVEIVPKFPHDFRRIAERAEEGDLRHPVSVSLDAVEDAE